MSTGFPPTILYPENFDSDFSLFKVYNTTFTTIAADNPPYADEIPIIPVPNGDNEIWGTNGYATISGELLYYDQVDLNSAGHVCNLKRCVRNIGGEPTQYNVAGTTIYSFVVAEHHNQLVDCAIAIEKFIGENFSLNPITLDWRIRHLADEAIDDSCPAIDFTFETVETSAAGTLISYALTITGAFNSYDIQFGDGSDTQSATSGTHLYAPGATIDPAVVVTSNACQIVQTPINRTATTTPVTTPPPPPFAVPVPIPPAIPPIVIPSIVLPAPAINIPPVIFPTVTPASFPSVIVVSPPINIPSQINISPINIPSTITISPPLSVPNQISVIMPHPIPPQITTDIPDQIQIAPAPPIPPIQITPPNIPPVHMIPPNIPSLPSVIIIESLNVLTDLATSFNNLAMSLDKNPFPSVIHFDSLPKMEIDHDSITKASKIMSDGFMYFADRLESSFESFRLSMPSANDLLPPSIKVDWGETPKLTAILKLQSPKQTSSVNEEGFALVDYETIDFPSEIKISPPDIPPIQITHNIPESIMVIPPDAESMTIRGPDKPLEVRMVPPDNMTVSLVAHDLPDVKFDTRRLESIAIPVIFPDEIPHLKVDMPTEVRMVGMVDTVELKYNGPSVIDIRVPENTRIPLFYDGPPLPVQVSLSVQELAGEAKSDKTFHVAIVPCPK
jgi:hypothetical protein